MRDNLALFLPFYYTKRSKKTFNNTESMSMKSIVTAIAVLFVFASCKKAVSELPPETQTGAETFGAKVNGVIWGPQGFGGFPGDMLEGSYTGPSSVMIKARNFRQSPKESEFEIFLHNITGPGTYQLNTDVTRPNLTASYGYYVEREFTPKNEWQTSSSYTGTVTITRFDTVEGILSGTFQFNAINLYNSPAPITVTEGRFDLKL